MLIISGLEKSKPVCRGGQKYEELSSEAVHALTSVSDFHGSH